MSKAFISTLIVPIVLFATTYSGPSVAQSTPSASDGQATIDILKSTPVSTFALGIIRLSDYVMRLGRRGFPTLDAANHTYVGDAHYDGERITVSFYADEIDSESAASPTERCEALLKIVRIEVSRGGVSRLALQFYTTDIGPDKVNLKALDALIDVKVRFEKTDCTAPLIGDGYAMQDF